MATQNFTADQLATIRDALYLQMELLYDECRNHEGTEEHAEYAASYNNAGAALQAVETAMAA